MAERNIKLPLFLTRLSVFLFLLPWQTMRFTSPDSINGIAKGFYKFTMPGWLVTASGVLMMALLFAFLLGIKKRISYGVLFILHAVGTLTTYSKLFPPYEQFDRLFLAAIPTAGAMLLLYCLRDEDTMFSLNK